MTEQSRSVRVRLDSLSSAISQLSRVSPAKPPSADETIKYPTLQLPITRKQEEHRLLERVHSQPPVARNGWGSTDASSDSDELTPPTSSMSQESQADISKEEELLEHYDNNDQSKHHAKSKSEEYLDDDDEIFGVIDYHHQWHTWCCY